MKYRYIVFDTYDLGYGEEITKDYIIGKANTNTEVRNIMCQQVNDTDGECYLMVYDKELKTFVDIMEF